MNPITGEVIEDLTEVFVYPATHYVTSSEILEKAIIGIEEELDTYLRKLELKGKMLEAQTLADADAL